MREEVSYKVHSPQMSLLFHLMSIPYQPPGRAGLINAIRREIGGDVRD
jgi:hypothetical protein